jgi:hypothetical protein
MSETTALLDAVLPFDSDPLEDAEIGAASAALSNFLEEYAADPAAR